MKRIVTPSQTIGPYLHLGLPPVQPLAGGDIPGERITLRGRVLDGHGEPVSDGLLETWQANDRGKYAHPDDWQDKQTTPGFTGFGRVYTGTDGGFRIDTIRPGAVPWPGTDSAEGSGGRQQAPHIVVCFFARGLLRHVVTRVYFGDDPATADDPVLERIGDAARRATLLAQPDGGTGGSYTWDIVLQGANETVFFDV